MRIAIGTDHNGVVIKNEISTYLAQKDYTIIDCSPQNDPRDDYPDFAFKVGEKINQNEAELGILLCGTGIGMSIAANKIKGIRCAHVTSIEEASLAKEHNNANVIALSMHHDVKHLINILEIFINTKFTNDERHLRRVNKISKYEQGEYNV